MFLFSNKNKLNDIKKIINIKKYKSILERSTLKKNNIKRTNQYSNNRNIQVVEFRNEYILELIAIYRQ